MRIIRKTAYKFDELSERVKKIVREQNFDINVSDDTEWDEPILQLWAQMLHSIGFTDPEILYTGFCSQGDGASFTSDLDFVRFARFLASPPSPLASLQTHSDDEFGQHLIHKIGSLKNDYSDYWASLQKAPNLGDLSGKVVRTSCQYYHESTCAIELDYRIENADFNKIFPMLMELRRKCCRGIYKDLNDSYDYLTSDDMIDESIMANDYEFYENGELV